MRFDVLITAVANLRVKTVMARHLSEFKGMPLQGAVALFNTLPVRYATDVSRTEAQALISRLEKMGATITLVESKPPMRSAPSQRYPSAEESFDQKTPVIETNVAGEDAAGSPPGAVAAPAPYIKKNMTFTATPYPRSSRFSSPGVALPAAKKPSPAIPIVIAASILLAALLYGMNSRHPVAQKTIPEPVSTAAQIQRSWEYVDSAAQSTVVLRAIMLYKMAIHFNKRNIQAWYGLVGTYQDAGMEAEAAEARQKMREIFGDQSLSLKSALDHFGKVTEMSVDKNGILRVEYASSSNKQERLFYETYALLRAASMTSHCTAASLYARTGNGTGMLVHIAPLSPYPPSLTEFKKRATISFIEK